MDYLTDVCSNWVYCNTHVCVAKHIYIYIYILSGAPLIRTPLGPSASGRIIEVSSSQGLLIEQTRVWLIAKIDDVMQPVIPRAKRVEATEREINSSSALVALYLTSSSSFCLFSK